MSMKERLRLAFAGIISAALLGGCIFSRSVNYPAPDAPEGFALIDAYEVGRPQDYVKFHGDGDFENLRAKVMYHNPESMAWEPFGWILLKGPGDTDTMKHSTDLGGGLRNLRYFAVQFSDGVLHELRLNGAHNDLHIYVR